MIGSTIGSYKITEQLGEGGMGAVYRATDNIEREVAVKALHSHLTRDENRLQRFRAEAVALGRLHHPNIAALYHLLEQNNDYYMVMEYVDGQTLEDIVRARGALSPEVALPIFIEGLKGFEHAHARGVIHRDIKPSNLMVSTEGTTKITDFGIARMAGAGRMTQTGKVIGTLGYMSPEQVRGQEQDARSDIYSLGILLFELLTGRMPFDSTSDYELMRAHLEQAPPPARSVVATLPPSLDSIIAKALAKDPGARFQSVAEMRQALEAVARDLPAAPPATSLVTPQTRQANIPTRLPETAEGQSNQASNNGGRRNVAPPPSSTPKWAIPAGAALIAVVLLGGFLTWNSKLSNGIDQVVPAPTSVALPTTAATQLPDTPNTVATSSPISGGGELTNNVPPPSQPSNELGGNTVIQFPDSETPSPTATTRVQPTAVPATPIPKPPASHPRERVATPPRPRKRLVERPKPRPRVVSSNRTKVRPRPAVVRRPTPRRRPTHQMSEADSIRAIIKGGG